MIKKIKRPENKNIVHAGSTHVAKVAYRAG
jgi:hypothetical protein